VTAARVPHMRLSRGWASCCNLGKAQGAACTELDLAWEPTSICPRLWVEGDGTVARAGACVLYSAGRAESAEHVK